MKKRMKASTTTVDSLKDDELIEIFMRLPVEVVHRMKCVSKRWLALISSPCFIHCYIQQRSSLPICDHFLVHRLDGFCWESGGGHIALCDEILPLGKFFNFSCDFLPLVQNRPIEYHPRHEYPLCDFKIMGISHGLILCKADLKPKPKCAFYVCNPMTKQWVKLPRLRYKRNKIVEIVGFMCYSLDRDLPHKVEFTVVEVETKAVETEYFYAYVFSSNTGRWTKSRVDGSWGLEWPLRQINDVVVYDGKFHWNGGSCIVAYGPLNEPNQCNRIPFPKGLWNRKRVQLTEGYIRVISFPLYGDGRTCRIWRLMDYSKATWCLEYTVEVPFYQCRFPLWLGCLSQCNREIAYLWDYSSSKRSKFVLFNVESGLVERVFIIPRKYRGSQEMCYISHDYLQPFVMTSWPTLIPQLPVKN